MSGQVDCWLLPRFEFRSSLYRSANFDLTTRLPGWTFDSDWFDFQFTCFDCMEQRWTLYSRKEVFCFLRSQYLQLYFSAERFLLVRWMMERQHIILQSGILADQPFVMEFNSSTMMNSDQKAVSGQSKNRRLASIVSWVSDSNGINLQPLMNSVIWTILCSIFEWVWVCLALIWS